MKLLTNNIPTSLNLPVLLAHNNTSVLDLMHMVIAYMYLKDCMRSYLLGYLHVLLVAYMDQCITYIQVDMVDCMQTC